MNLKRPSLKLSPLPSTAPGPAQHALEFAFDCAAPKCALRVLALPHAPGAAPAPVYEAVVPGGFARAVTLEDEICLELAKFEPFGEDVDGNAQEQEVLLESIRVRRGVVSCCGTWIT